MKYKVGDKVRIKSLDWYNENRDEYGYVDCGSRAFFTKMSNWCGKIATIKEICKTNCYRLEEYDFDWTDEMIEGLAEEEISYDTESEWLKHEISLPEGYIFKDENGNVINATKIVLEKKKKEYPKTYEECSDILSVYTDPDISGYKGELLWTFQKLLTCRDAYWKIAGEEMGLGKPWEPGDNKVFGIIRQHNKIQKYNDFVGGSTILEFPTEEMRDAFYENFKEEIEQCKELL